MPSDDNVKDSGLHTEVESCAFLNLLEATSSRIGWNNSLRDAAKIDQAFEATTAKHKEVPNTIRGKVRILELSFKALFGQLIHDANELSKCRLP